MAAAGWRSVALSFSGNGRASVVANWRRGTLEAYGRNQWRQRRRARKIMSERPATANDSQRPNWHGVLIGAANVMAFDVRAS